MRLQFKNWLLKEDGGIVGVPGTQFKEPRPSDACPACVSFNKYPPPTPSSSAPAQLAKSYPGNAGESGGPGPRTAGGGGGGATATPASTATAVPSKTPASSGIPATTPIN